MKRIALALVLAATNAAADDRSECVLALAQHDNLATEIDILMRQLVVFPARIEPLGERPVTGEFGKDIQSVKAILEKQREALSNLCRDKI